MIKLIEEKITKQYLKELDQNLEFIPLTFDPVFKGVFGNQTELLKKFLISVLYLELPPEKCILKILNPELPVQNYKEYKKTIDFNILLNNSILIDIEINRVDFKKVKYRNNIYQNKKFSMILERGNNTKKLNNMYFYQLKLNTENKSEKNGNHEIVLYDLTTKTIYIENERTFLKYLEFYHKLYYTKRKKLNEEEIWLAALASTNFTELNEILSHILSNHDRNKFMKEVIRMNWNGFNIHEWEKEKCEELVRLESERIEKENRKAATEKSWKDGMEKGIEQNITATIKAMLENNLDMNLISKITNKTVKEIKEIADGFTN